MSDNTSNLAEHGRKYRDKGEPYPMPFDAHNSCPRCGVVGSVRKVAPATHNPEDCAAIAAMRKALAEVNRRERPMTGTERNLAVDRPVCGIAGCTGKHGPGDHNTIIEAELSVVDGLLAEIVAIKREWRSEVDAMRSVVEAALEFRVLLGGLQHLR